eukprot:558234-Amphidinium_carterae.1
MITALVAPSSSAPKMSDLLDIIHKSSVAAAITEIPPDFAYVGGSPLAVREQLLTAIRSLGSAVQKDEEFNLKDALFIVSIFSLAVLSAIAGPMQVLASSIGVGRAPKLTKHAEKACRTLSTLVTHLAGCPAATRNSVPLSIPEALVSSMSMSRPAVGLLSLPLEPSLRHEINETLTQMLAS